MSIAACGAILAASSLTAIKPAAAKSNPCPGVNPSLFVHSVTKSFDVYICGGDTPHEYVGVSKKNGAKIVLSLSSFDGRNDIYTAVNGYYRYTLTRNNLKVTNNGKVIVNEKANLLRFP